MSHSLPGQRHQTSLPCLRGGLLRWLLFQIRPRPRERLGSWPCQSVWRLLRAESRVRRYTQFIMSDVTMCAYFPLSPILTFGGSQLRKDILFFRRATEGGAGRRRRWNSCQESWRSSHKHHRGCSHCYWHPTWWVLPKARPKNEPYVMEIHDPVNMSKWSRRPLVADI